MFFTKGEPERHSAFGMTPSASALFSPQSRTLRLRAEMPYSCTALAREKSALEASITSISHNFFVLSIFCVFVNIFKFISEKGE
jgi:hypothetical protein